MFMISKVSSFGMPGNTTAGATFVVHRVIPGRAEKYKEAAYVH